MMRLLPRDSPRGANLLAYATELCPKGVQSDRDFRVAFKVLFQIQEFSQKRSKNLLNCLSRLDHLSQMFPQLIERRDWSFVVRLAFGHFYLHIFSWFYCRGSY
ncbi:hypothetical protein DFAR_3060014 [Desulfarculales bacterium]